jgi:hypothetical protein
MTTRYTSPDEDSGRWHGFPFRAGDIVVSTRSKSGTTWVQMICALLVFRGPDLPRPLGELSPWLDWRVEPREVVLARLEAQDHRRIVKTHTPLDGMPLDPRATYVVVGRHPLDAAVSLYHHSANIERVRLHELLGNDAPAERADPRPPPPLGEWLRRWIAWEGEPAERLDSLPGMLHHATDALARRAAPNVVLVHYDDLRADLPGEVARLADRLGIELAPGEAAELAGHATFAAMRVRSADLVPDRLGVLRAPARFFRDGRSGSGEALLAPDELVAYRQRVHRAAPADVVDWLHRW